MDEVLKIIKNDPWLEPYADAINGRHQHAIEKEKELTGKRPCLTLQQAIYTMVCIVRTKDGFSANGRPTLQLFT